MNPSALVGYLGKLSEADRGAKAALKMALFPQLEHRAYPYLAKHVDLRNPVQLAIANLIAYGVAAGMHSAEGGSLGAALRKMSRKRESDTAERMLNAIFTVQDRKRRSEMVARVVSAIASLDLRLDLAQLGFDLLAFSRKTQRKWAADFYAAEEKPAEPVDASKKDENM